ncbi:MAG: hypothetical protein LQ338_000908 [Usnochroma carphineum]|nr:MAG: hypothetical protein LQ338_000908 [Usnochroma carphineum]
MLETEYVAQFLNSVLSSIGGDGQQTILSSPQAQPGPKPQANNLNTMATAKFNASRPNGLVPGQKRKAEDSLPMLKAKAFKDEQGQRHAKGAESGVEKAPREVTRPTISTSKSALAVPYRGTSRQTPVSVSPDTATSDASRPAPKKGSYAEIMARASANNKPTVGVIKHKPKEAISAKKEILMRKKGILPKARPGTKDDRNGAGQDRGSPRKSPATAKSPGLPGKMVTQPSYKGTAAPKPQPAYKGTMKPRSSIADTARRKDSRDDRSRSNSINPPRRGRDYESEDEEDEIDEEEELGSNDSDDMEAGFSDVEEEETAAMRAAKKEDEEELRMENQLKKEKEERKKKLAAMAAKAPKPKY